ncbi:chromate efflux transporter [Alcaligenes faecalis]|jgi:chromate transporter|uniref:Chromate efflux transporter n=1 Tax=Alcaligenes faecalis TaxID=511 RepID=A0ABY7N6B4_ALCFA|nr:chromate efflux transporter [Alcaligenes faecalis]WBM38725.1 chromate efflux transporter [Alcaligenes faecalis]
MNSSSKPVQQQAAVQQGGPLEVFWAFLKLGLTSFGGPIAHLGYFRSEFVERRRWLDEHSYSDLVALCQFLPGPASSQVGMAIGLGRAGWMGLLAAWTGFTLPSAIALILFALGLAGLHGVAESPWVHGLKIVAVAIVAQAVLGMARSLCPDRGRAALAILAALLSLLLPSAFGQVAAIALTGLLAWWRLDVAQAGAMQAHAYPVTRKVGMAALLLFAGLLLALPVWATVTGSSTVQLLEGVYRSGALVFGGGHVVLPLLQASVVPGGAVSNADLMVGYGAAQAVPGPLFTFAAYIGAIAQGPLHGWLGGLILLVVIFVPAFLILIGVLPFWQGLRHRAGIRTAMAGVNAGVVGILGAALYDPVWTSAIHSRADFGLALCLFGLLTVGRVPPALVVLLAGLGAWGISVV